MGTFPTTVTLTYVTSPPTVIAGVTQTATATLPVRTAEDYTSTIRNICLYGGFWSTSPTTGIISFVPWSQITAVTAQ